MNLAFFQRQQGKRGRRQTAAPGGPAASPGRPQGQPQRTRPIASSIATICACWPRSMRGCWSRKTRSALPKLVWDRWLGRAADAYDAACCLSQCIPIVANHASWTPLQAQEAAQFYGDAAMKLSARGGEQGFQERGDHEEGRRSRSAAPAARFPEASRGLTPLDIGLPSLMISLIDRSTNRRHEAEPAKPGRDRPPALSRARLHRHRHRAVLDAAEARSGSLYYFFPTKEDLLLAVLRKVQGAALADGDSAGF